MNHTKEVKILLATCGSWWLGHTASAFDKRDALAGFWITDKNSAGIPTQLYRRCWPFQLGMKPFYHTSSQIVVEKMFYNLFPLWKQWISHQIWPECNVVQAIMGYATEPFDHAEKVGALKVVDCPNSHPTSYYGYWQRECDLWCPGERVPIPQWMFARMNRELVRADLVLCPSLFVRETMILNGIPADKCLVNPFGVNTEVFRKRTKLPEKPRFITVGTICVRKGFQYLFRAFEIVKRQVPDAELLVVGDYKTDFRLERPHWEGMITHYQNVSHTELSKLLQTCTAFVFPSLEEGFARVIPEAMGAGLPIIATHESGATTLVDDGVEGFIVQGCNPQHIAEAMIRVAENRVMNSLMGEAAHRKGAASNTWQDYGDRLLTEYSKRFKS